jgi:hypothetical protein
LAGETGEQKALLENKDGASVVRGALSLFYPPAIMGTRKISTPSGIAVFSKFGLEIT